MLLFNRSNSFERQDQTYAVFITSYTKTEKSQRKAWTHRFEASSIRSKMVLFRLCTRAPVKVLRFGPDLDWTVSDWLKKKRSSSLIFVQINPAHSQPIRIYERDRQGMRADLRMNQNGHLVLCNSQMISKIFWHTQIVTVTVPSRI